MTLYCISKSMRLVLFPSRQARSRFSRNRSQGGFSLIEVVIAIGIVAFAFVPMLALVPMGLNSSRQAVDNTIEAQIVQELTNQVQETDYSQLSQLSTSTATTPLSFDQDGNPATATSLVAYKASIVYTVPVVGTSSATTMTSGSSASGTTARLGVVTIYIISTHSYGGAAATNLALNLASKKYIVLVADNGR